MKDQTFLACRNKNNEFKDLWIFCPKYCKFLAKMFLLQDLKERTIIIYN